ncbi:spermatogenesis-associated protein 22-like [Zootermopsis nevadensis]|uniref:Spermatogenesis-associated protein 22 n=1 Tax=Zootermopsis nevadensis TaxID=136037 RepID=A0A067R5F9_ZOONE|nr:spermatogenesis-associated protein 22-like [Zootermopsis nevadensis]KDR18403.1 Spermatogenesis-associated protein 22 [Zootermopsis nevadensis]
MNNNFKMNKLKPRLAAGSPYQRPNLGGVGQNMYNPFQSNSTMGNAIRFPPSQQMMPAMTPYSSRTPTYGFPYFQEVPFCSEQWSPTPHAMQDYGPPTEIIEDTTSDKEDSSGSKELKPTPSTSLSKTSDRQVRFSLSTNQSSSKMTDATKRWEDDPRPSRVLTGPIDKIIKWEKMRETCGLLFEVVAPLVTVRSGGFRCEKMLLLRDEATPALQCLFYTIDRPLPSLQKGQLVRCVGEMVSKNKLKAYSVRAATAGEKAGLQRLFFASQRAVTALMLATPEP